ncbi:MAG: hypothetical protein WCF16_02405, partial [Alphaproteobacteria bacterium]
MTEKATRYLKGEISVEEFRKAAPQLNTTHFEGPGQVIAAIDDIARMLPEEKVISNAVTKMQAGKLGLTPGQLASGLESKLFDRRQIMATGMLAQSSAAKLQEFAAKAAATQAPEDIARFQEAFTLTYGIMRTLKGQSAEIARALQIQAALRKSQGRMLDAVNQIIDQTGGTAVNVDLAKKIAALPAEELVPFVERAARATTRDKIVYVWSNLLLSNPATDVVNIGDTSLATLMQVPETWLASKIGGNVAPGEAGARLAGQIQGFKYGLRLAWKAWTTGESTFAAGSRVETGAGIAAPQADLVTSIAPKGGPWGPRQTTGAAMRYLEMAIPTRHMMAGDELTKTVNQYGEMYALALRDGWKNGLGGEALSKHIDDLVSNPPEWLWEQGRAQAVTGTFNDPLTGVGKSLADAVNGFNARIGDLEIPVGRLMLATFVRTPTNIFRWAAKRTPMGFLAPQVQADLAAGGAARDLAIARIATGSALMAAFADLALAGKITGAGPKHRMEGD